MSKAKSLDKKDKVLIKLKEWKYRLPIESNGRKILEEAINLLNTYKSPEEVKKLTSKALMHGVDWANDKW